MIASHGRNLYIDNVKAILIFLVVFGHFIEMNIRNDIALKSIWIFIYFFHMPMFALVSGMFSKTSLNEKQSTQLLRKIVIPLFAFQLLYEGLEILTTGRPSIYFEQFAPYWILWYLFSLLCWRLMLPVFARLRFPLTTAIAISIFLSYSDNTGYFLSISRTLTFFPFFLLGWKVGNGFLATSGKKSRILSAAVLVAAITGSAISNDWDYRWLYGSYSLATLHMANLNGAIYQLALYGVSALIGIAFLNVITRKDIGIARFGRNSMVIYLWHGFVVIALSKTGATDWIFGMGSLPALLILSAISVAIMITASLPAWISLTDKWIVHPFERLFIKQALRPGAGEVAQPDPSRRETTGMRRETTGPDAS